MSRADDIDMRTTIRMNAELATRAKEYARRQGRTFTELVTEAVSDFINRPENRRPRKRIVFPTAGVKNGRKFTDAEYRAMIERMDEEDAERIMKGMVGR